MTTVKAVRIISPISGESVNPRMITRQYGDKIYEEAHWIDPASGTFIRKGIVRVLDSVTKEDITASCN